MTPENQLLRDMLDVIEHADYPGSYVRALDELEAMLCDALTQPAPPASQEPLGWVESDGSARWANGAPKADSLLFAVPPASQGQAKWCEYVAGMVFGYMEDDFKDKADEDRRVKDIAGIIERRLWALKREASQEQAQQPSGGVPEGPAPYSINEIEAWADDADKHGLKFVPVSSATLRLIVGGLRATRCGVPNCWKGFEK